MTSTRPTLAAAHRELMGKAVAQLRRDGRLPAVVFGHGIESTPVTLDAHDFDRLRRHLGANALVDLSVDGKKARPVLIHGVQVHRITQRPIHADLFVVKMTEEMIVDVPLVPVGASPAVEQTGGTLLLILESLKMKALPDHLPQSIELPVERLGDFDTVLRVSDLVIPADATLLTDPDEVVAKVAPPRVEAVEVPTEAEELAAAEGEGAEAEGEAPAEGEGGDAEG
jgi:large subunit ribosomal protein L25